MTREVTPQEVRRLLEDKADLQLVDCRTREEHAIAHVEGAVLLPMDELAERLAELDAARPVVVYCHTGRRSLLVASALTRAGFQDARSMAGGIHRWALEIDSDVPVY